MKLKSGKMYTRDGVEYICLDAEKNIVSNFITGYTFRAHDIIFNSNGTIDWKRQSNGYFVKDSAL